MKTKTKLTLIILFLACIASYGQKITFSIEKIEKKENFTLFASGDIDADGDKDIVSISDRNIIIFLNNHGNFEDSSLSLPYSTTGVATCIYSKNINNSPEEEIIITVNKKLLIININKNKIIELFAFPLEGDADILTAGDADMDNKTDIVVSVYNKIIIFFNEKNNIFLEKDYDSGSFGAGKITVSPLGFDTKNKIIVARSGFGGAISYFEMAKDRILSTPTLIALQGQQPKDFIVGDVFDNNKNNKIAVVTDGPDGSWLSLINMIQAKQASGMPLARLPDYVRYADFDGNSDKELLILYQREFNLSKMTLLTIANVSISFNFATAKIIGIVVNDFNTDGKNDIIMMDSSSLIMMKNLTKNNE